MMGFFGRSLAGGAIGGLMTGDLGGVAGGALAGGVGMWAGAKALGSKGRLGGAVGLANRGIGGLLRADEFLGGSRRMIGKGYRKMMGGFGRREKMASGLMQGQDWISRNAISINKYGGYALGAIGAAAAGSIGSSVLSSNRGY